MNEKKWGIVLIISSAVLITAISLLFYSLKAPMGADVQWGLRIFAIAACAAQFIVFLSFAKAYKRNRRY